MFDFSKIPDDSGECNNEEDEFEKEMRLEAARKKKVDADNLVLSGLEGKDVTISIRDPEKEAQEAKAKQEAIDKAKELKEKQEALPFTQVGRMVRGQGHQGYKEDCMENVDWFSEILNLPTPARRMFDLIRIRSPRTTNKAVLPKPKTDAEKVKVSRGIVVLKKKGIVRAWGDHRYMINPRILIPPKKNQKAALSMWNELG